MLVTATLAEPVWARLQVDFPGIAPAFGPGLHRTAPGVLEQLVDCSGGTSSPRRRASRARPMPWNASCASRWARLLYSPAMFVVSCKLSNHCHLGAGLVCGIVAIQVLVAIYVLQCPHVLL